MSVVLSKEAFDAVCGEGFALAGSELSLRLTRVEALSQPRLDGSPAFVLNFEVEGFLPQDTYTLTHPAFGEQLIFLVPLGVQGNQTRLEAIFS